VAFLLLFSFPFGVIDRNDLLPVWQLRVLNPFASAGFGVHGILRSGTPNALICVRVGAFPPLWAFPYELNTSPVFPSLRLNDRFSFHAPNPPYKSPPSLEGLLRLGNSDLSSPLSLNLVSRGATGKSTVFTLEFPGALLPLSRSLKTSPSKNVSCGRSSLPPWPDRIPVSLIPALYVQHGRSFEFPLTFLAFL